MMIKYLCVALLLFLLSSCKEAVDNNESEYKTYAERFLRGEYGCDPSVIDELAADSIKISYPIFEKLFGTPVIRGKDSAKQFLKHFCDTWKETKITIHNTVTEGSNVVFLWSFSARNFGSTVPDEQSDSLVYSWGGITLIQFNDEGKIFAEIGEESTPGPFERLTFSAK
jgi:hypothetical protein